MGGLSARRGPTSTAPRSALVREQLEEAIRRGDFKPGQRLPSERELVQTYGISRVSVREAIQTLAAFGVVRVEQGRGAFVSEHGSALAQPLARWLAHHRDEVLELHRVRGALEELAAECAAERGGGVELLQRAHEALAAAVAEDAPAEELVRLDIEFHIVLAQLSGNRLLFDLLYDHHTKLSRSRRVAFSRPERPQESVAEHARIVRAITDGDPGAARRAVHAHVRAIGELIAAALAQSDGVVA